MSNENFLESRFFTGLCEIRALQVLGKGKIVAREPQMLVNYEKKGLLVKGKLVKDIDNIYLYDGFGEVKIDNLERADEIKSAIEAGKYKYQWFKPAG